MVLSETDTKRVYKAIDEIKSRPIAADLKKVRFAAKAAKIYLSAFEAWMVWKWYSAKIGVVWVNDPSEKDVFAAIRMLREAV